MVATINGNTYVTPHVHLLSWKRKNHRGSANKADHGQLLQQGFKYSVKYPAKLLIHKY